MIGLLPLSGGRDTYRHAIPHAVYWELCHIPGQEVCDMRSIVSCIELDRLKVPKSMDDTAGYSKLAAETGVDYLVAGAVEHQDTSRVRFRIVVYSATDPRLSREHTYSCRLSALMKSAVSAAKDIVSDEGVPVPSDLKFDTRPVRTQALKALNGSIDMSAGCERDAADFEKCTRLAERARSLCPESPLVSEWVAFWSSYTQAGLDAYVVLHRRDPSNAEILDMLVRQCLYLKQQTRAVDYARKTLALDPSSRLAQLAVTGKTTDSPGPVWRRRLYDATSYSMVDDVRRLRATLGQLEAQCPSSAYVRYRAAYMLSDVSDNGSAACAYEDAARLNPSSFRLQMRLIKGYLDTYQEAKALAVAQKALKRWPKRSECHAAAARAYRVDREYSKAADEMRTALKLDPDAYADRAFLARQEMRSGNIAEGLRAITSAGPGAKHAVVVVCVVLVFLFLVIAVIVAAAVVHLLKRDTKPGA